METFFCNLQGSSVFHTLIKDFGVTSPQHSVTLKMI